jgi:squalene-hopene/tetraprenyl-beta-curcumene cyclase
MIALLLEGYGADSRPIKKGLQAMNNFAWEDEEGLRIQACVSPVWDTALSSISLMDCGVSQTSPSLKGAVKWILDRQLNVDYGDWKVYRPGLTSGGWSFEYSNSWYPDVDDTAAVLLALLKQDPRSAHSKPVNRAIEWVLGMQNRDGGWAAFDVDNDKLFLNEIPFADIDALCDPSTPDVAGRVIESFGVLLEKIRPATHDSDESFLTLDLISRIESANQRAIEYLRRSQEPEGAWFGRWGVNYIYGTSNVLCGLSCVRLPGINPMIQSALKWLKSCQNHDGGWGESLLSYSDRSWMGKGDSSASQTAWALMGLLSYLPPDDPAIQKGIRWLVQAQTPAPGRDAFEAGIRVPDARGSTWTEPQFTGPGFPKHFYLRYH